MMITKIAPALTGAFLIALGQAGGAEAKPYSVMTSNLVSNCGNLGTEYGQRTCLSATVLEVSDMAHEAVEGLNTADGFRSGLAHGQLIKDCFSISSDRYENRPLSAAWTQSLSDSSTCLNSIIDVEDDRGWTISKTGFNTLANHVMQLKSHLTR